VVQLLLQAVPAEQALRNADAYGKTTLMLAAEKGHTAVVELLLRQQNILIHTADENGKTAFLRAAAYGHVDTAMLLHQVALREREKRHAKEERVKGRWMGVGR
jgi:ankyrin repeat protein